MSLWTSRTLCSLVVSAAWLIATPASAYLLDASDATVAAPGALELEIQPSGYFASIGPSSRADDITHQVVPSLNLVAGLGSRFDLTLTTRGLLDPTTRGPSVGESSIAVRLLLVDGGYASGEGEDPSLALQFGVGLPEIGGEPGAAPGVAVLLSFVVSDFSAHLHTELILTRGHEREVFASAVIQAPSTWLVQPVAELWVDVVEDEPTVSGLLGAVVPVHGDVALEAGVRLAGRQRVEAVEVRLALAWVTRWAAPSLY